MALPKELRQRFCKAVTLGTGDTSKELMPAATGVKYYVSDCLIICLVSAAQAVFVGDSSGTNKFLSVAASFTLHAQAFFNSDDEGLGLNVGESLIIKPAAAGPSFFCIASGYIERQAAALV